MRLRATALLAALLVAGCGGDGGGGETTGAAETETAATATETVATTTETVATTTETEAGLAQSCTNEEDGFTIGYPEGWHTNEGDGVPACTFFHAEEFELPEATEVLDVAIRVDRESVAFEDVQGENPAEEIVSREEVEVAGRPAVRVEYVATGQALLPEGTRGTRYAVDLDGETLIATTFEGPGLDYEANVEALDRMVESLEIDG